MDDHLEYLPMDEGSQERLVQKFEEMRLTDARYYFDIEELEELVDYYMFHPDSHKAFEVLELGKEQHPDSMGLAIKEAEALFYSDRVDQAIHLLDNLSLYGNADYEHYFSQASIYSMAERKDKAIEILSHLVEIAEGDDLFEAKMALAKEFQEISDYQRAIEIYQEVLRNTPDSDDALLELSMSFELSLDYDYGIRVIMDFIDEHPYNHLAWFSLGNLYLLIDNYEESYRAFEYAGLIKPDFKESFFNMGNMLMKVEKYNEAIDAFKQSLGKDAFENSIGLNFIGHCYIIENRNEEALKYFKKAIEGNPDYADGWLGSAIAYSNLTLFEESLLCVEKAMKIAPNNMYYKYFYGDTVFNMGDFERAEQIYQEVFESDAITSGLVIDYAESLIVNEKTDKAQQALVDGIQKFPDEPLLYYRYAALMLQMGLEIDAESILMIALDLAPEKSQELFKFFPEAENFAGIMDLIENYN